MTHPISIIGAPTDIGAGVRGASMGPEALRVANIVSVLQGLGLEVIDRGNLSGPPNPWLPPTEGYRHLAEVVAWNKAVHNGVHAELALGRMPILLGGDHCLGLGSITAVSRWCVDTADLPWRSVSVATIRPCSAVARRVTTPVSPLFSSTNSPGG